MERGRAAGRPRRDRGTNAPGSPPPDLPVPSDLRDYGLVGNLNTAALVSRFGSVDWACLPRFLSPSVFARILDPQRGGFHAVQPIEPATSEQSYLRSTAILDTQFSFPDGRQLDVIDLMPIGDGPGAEGRPMLLRIAEARGGRVPVRVTFAPRFDFGRREPLWRKTSEGWLAEASDVQLLQICEGDAVRRGERVEVDRVVEPGIPFVVEVSLGERRWVGQPAIELRRDTERFWRGWVHTSKSPLHAVAHRWHEWVKRSEITLKLLSRADNGAFVAAPTTSIPSWPGGSRNWDYRYVWIRDAAFSAEAMLLLGHAKEARGFLTWVVSRSRDGAGGLLRVMYGPHGERELTEREIPELSGFLGSRPVRVGNAAAEQFQLDIYGEVFDAAALLAERQDDFVRPIWPDLSRLANEVDQAWEQPDHGIWEIRRPPAHYVHSKVMAWVALDRASRLARRFGDRDGAERWRESADRVRRAVLTRGYDAAAGGFVQAFGSSRTDAANLRIPLVGFLPYDDPRVLRTVDWVERELGTGPFLHRYISSDGISDPEATFLPCAFWLVEVLARAGRRTEALSRFQGLLKAASPLRLFSEAYDPGRGLMLGNYPQAITHIAVLRAALALGLSSSRSSIPEGFGWLPRYLRPPE